MASIRTRTGSTGKVSYTVTWRDASGKQCGETVGSKREAEKIKLRAEQHGKADGHEGVVRGTHRAAGFHGGRYTGIQPVKREPRLRDGRTGAVYISGYLETFLSQHGYRGRSAETARSHIEVHLVPAFASTPMRDITKDDTTSFIRRLEGTSMTAGTVSRIHGTASAMWTDAIEAGIVTGNPWLGTRVKKQHVRRRPENRMQPHHFAAIMDAIGPDYRLMVRTLGETGLRFGEAERLQPGDIVITQVKGETACYVRVLESKSKAGQRSVRISRELADDLRAALPFTAPHVSSKPVESGCSRLYRSFKKQFDKTVAWMLCEEYGCKRKPCSRIRSQGTLPSTRPTARIL